MSDACKHIEHRHERTTGRRIGLDARLNEWQPCPPVDAPAMTHTLRLTDAEARKLLSILSMATIEYADLIKTLCDQTGLPMPESTRDWLDRRGY